MTAMTVWRQGVKASKKYDKLSLNLVLLKKKKVPKQGTLR
jgi:hypothetical protein